MELKVNSGNCQVAQAVSFNRTFMELKDVGGDMLVYAGKF